MALPISYNIRNLIVRWKVTLLAIGGIALVVAVMLVLVAMSNGFRTALRATGSTENAIVIQRGQNSELTSGFSRDNANMIMVDSRVARDDQGKPLASPEIMIVLPVLATRSISWKIAFILPLRPMSPSNR